MSSSSLVQDVKKDFTADLALIVPAAEALAELGQLDDAIAKLMDLERSCRLANDFKNLKETCVAMVRLCHQRNDWNKLNATLAVLAKKRAQSKVAISAIVELAYTYVDSAPSEDVRMEFIKTLTDICEGKMYVEAESARLKLQMAQLYEARGDLTAAVGCIQDVHVETYGTLSKAEKIQFILHQIRLNLLRQDYIRTMIQSRKMNAKMLEENGMEKFKIQYNTLMIEYYLQAGTTGDANTSVNGSSGSAGGVNAAMEGAVNTWEVAQCYYKLLDCQLIRAQPEGALVEVLRNAAVFLLLTGHNIEQQGMLHRMLALKVFEEPIPLTAGKPEEAAGVDSAAPMESDSVAAATTTPIPTPAPTSAADVDSSIEGLKEEFAQNVPLLAPIHAVLRLFAKKELIPNSFSGLHVLRDQLRTVLGGESGTTVGFHSASTLSGLATERIATLTALLHVRVMQHNIRVIAGYYQRISMARMAALLGLGESELEEQMAELASSSDIYLRIDRPNGVVSFTPPARVDDTLNAWSSDVSRLLGIMEATSHLISRENMVHKVHGPPPATAAPDAATATA